MKSLSLRKPARRLTAQLIALSLAASLGGCGDSNEVAVQPTSQSSSLTGTITYERLLALGTISPDDGTVGPASLDFAHPVDSPCRFVRVQLLDSANRVLSETHTDALGAYNFASSSLRGPVKVRALAESVRMGSESAAIRVQDNTRDNAPYATESDLVVFGAVGQVDIDIPTGYDSDGDQAEGTPRSSAPFACLDGILTGYRYFLAAGLKAENLPVCIVNWSEQNRPGAPDKGETEEEARDDGRIGTSSFSSQSNELSILGFREADTDEFDWHIMIHEFGHWVQFNAFRDNSSGGPHTDGETKEPRLAFSEGFGNALGGLALSDAVYKDTTAMAGFCFSLECNLSVNTDPRPGWFSEGTVQTVLFDLFDPIREEGGDSRFSDRSELPLPFFISALTSQSESPALTTIFSFLAGLMEGGLNPAQTVALGELLAFESPSAAYGLNSTQEFGAGETHNGLFDSLPVYLDVDSWIGAGNVSVTIPGQPAPDTFNSLEGQRTLKFVGDGSTIAVTAFNSTSSTGAIAPVLYEDGRRLNDDDDDDDDELDDKKSDQTVVQVTKPGSIYVVVLINTSTATSTTDIRLTKQ